jgi:hypothetical protein
MESGWQADYNHDDFVDAGDVAYFGGRLGKNCNSQKADGDYAMDVRNLELPEFRGLMSRPDINLTAADVIALWDQMDLSYDPDLAADAIAGRPMRAAAINVPWTNLKVLYR